MRGEALASLPGRNRADLLASRIDRDVYRSADGRDAGLHHRAPPCSSAAAFQIVNIALLAQLDFLSASFLEWLLKTHENVWPPSPARILNQKCDDSGIPDDSFRWKNALVGESVQFCSDAPRHLV
jgi:hypothetical protein